jgi:AcrR family transcriptional regulator
VPDREPLNRERIIAAALALADADGVDALSMRTLAGRLGCAPMSLYNHVADKDELLAEMLEAVADEVGPPTPDRDPLEAIRLRAISTREVLVRHRWAAELWQRAVPGPARTRIMEELLAMLARTDLSPEAAHHGFHAVNNHVLGYTLQELGMTMGDDPEKTARDYQKAIVDDFPLMAAHIQQHLDGDTSRTFELVLDLILDGLTRLGPRSQGR